MSSAFEEYKHLENELVMTRWVHLGLESSEEDDILDQMDGAWCKLAAEEQARFNAEGARSLLRDSPVVTRIAYYDEDVWN